MERIVHTCRKFIYLFPTCLLVRIRSWLGTLQVSASVGGFSANVTLYLCAMQVVPILRAGLVLIEQISTVLPSQVTYHVGLVRNEETLQVNPCGKLENSMPSGVSTQASYPQEFQLHSWLTQAPLWLKLSTQGGWGRATVMRAGHHKCPVL